MKAALLFLAFSATAFADGECVARSPYRQSHDAYCASFGENACDTNRQFCLWQEYDPGESGSCEPLNNDEAFRSYCHSFERTACATNAAHCRWF